MKKNSGHLTISIICFCAVILQANIICAADARMFKTADTDNTKTKPKVLIPTQQEEDADFTRYQQQAALWRQTNPKPAVSEDIRRFRVLADDAVQNKDFEKAISYYEKGLAIDPLWPAGQFNAALINAELQQYWQAVIHMKRYLALEPNSKDSRAYQDKLYIWEEKAKEGQPQP